MCLLAEITLDLASAEVLVTYRIGEETVRRSGLIGSRRRKRDWIRANGRLWRHTDWPGIRHLSSRETRSEVLFRWRSVGWIRPERRSREGGGRGVTELLGGLGLWEGRGSGAEFSLHA